MKISNTESITRLTKLVFVKHFERYLVHISAIEVFAEYTHKMKTQTPGFTLETPVHHATFIICPNHWSYPGKIQGGHRSQAPAAQSGWGRACKVRQCGIKERVPHLGKLLLFKNQHFPMILCVT